MSGINIGTNFNYQGGNFLDSRQGMPQTTNDLLNWDILVPLGFEVCVGGEWYIYKGPEFWDTETGHWEKRITLHDYTDEINKLMTAVFPMTLSVSGGGTFEVGQSIRPTLSWTLRREDAELPADKVMIDNSILVSDPSSGQWTPSLPLTDTHTYNIKVWYDEATYTASIKCLFKLRKYWGVISDHPEDFSDVLGFPSAWGDDWTMDSKVFNCSGGGYPFYAIPRSLWPGEETFHMWIGGLRNSDFTHEPKRLINASGYTADYEVIILSTKQTGILNIRFGI